jgi:hypothetical protein
MLLSVLVRMIGFVWRGPVLRLGKKGMQWSTLVRIILLCILLALVIGFIILSTSDSNFIVNTIFGPVDDSGG